MNTWAALFCYLKFLLIPCLQSCFYTLLKFTYYFSFQLILLLDNYFRTKYFELLHSIDVVCTLISSDNGQ